ncbi:hypothetical protein DL93DRAFT_2085979, partial [Clavulina sp. PMI_390]
LFVRKKWSSSLMVRAVIGDWVIIRNGHHNRTFDSIWNWKTDRIWRIKARERCALLAPWGAVALMDVETATEETKVPRDGDEELSFTITSFLMEAATGTSEQGDVALDLSAKPQILHPPSDCAVSKVYWTPGGKTPPGWISESRLHGAEETKFFIDRDLWCSPPPRAWESLMFSITAPYKVSSFAIGAVQRSPYIVDWHTRTCLWDSPSQLEEEGVRVRPVAKKPLRRLVVATKKLFRFQSGQERARVRSSSLASGGSPVLEPQEPLLSSSLVGEGSWYVIGYQQAYQSDEESVAIQFPTRTYDNYSPFSGWSACMGFCPRSGTWLYRPIHWSGSQAVSDALPTASGSYASFTLLKFD